MPQTVSKRLKSIKREGKRKKGEGKNPHTNSVRNALKNLRGDLGFHLFRAPKRSIILLTFGKKKYDSVKGGSKRSVSQLIQTTVKLGFAGNPNLSSENIPAKLTKGRTTKKNTLMSRQI